MTEFAAQASISLADPAQLIGPFYDPMVEHGAEIDMSPDEHIIRFAQSQARFSFDHASMRVAATANSLEELYFIRLIVASHIVELFKGIAPDISWSGDGCDFIRPPNFQIMQVVDLRDLTPHMRRITLAGQDVARFATMTALHLNIMIQRLDLAEPQWPYVGANGLIRWDDPDHRPSLRKYTIREIDLDAGTIEIDFVLHAGTGPGSALALTTRIGDEIGIFGPGGGGLVDAEWYLFAGDETALPAIARMLEYLPQQARGLAFIEVNNESEIQPLTTRSKVEINWLLRHGAQTGTTNLLVDAVRSTDFPTDGSSLYVWAGCEFEAFRTIRHHLRKERGLSKQEHLAVAYWRRGKSENEAGDPAMAQKLRPRPILGVE